MIKTKLSLEPPKLSIYYALLVAVLLLTCTPAPDSDSPLQLPQPPSIDKATLLEVLNKIDIEALAQAAASHPGICVDVSLARHNLNQLQAVFRDIFEAQRTVHTPISLQCSVSTPNSQHNIEPITAAVTYGYPADIIEGLTQLGGSVPGNTLVWALAMSRDISVIQLLITHGQRSISRIEQQPLIPSSIWPNSLIYTIYHHSKLATSDRQRLIEALVKAGASATNALLHILPEKTCGSFTLLQHLIKHANVPQVAQHLQQHHLPAPLLLLYNKHLAPTDKAALIKIWWRSGGITEHALRTLLKKHTPRLDAEHQRIIQQIFGHPTA